MPQVVLHSSKDGSAAICVREAFLPFSKKIERMGYNADFFGVSANIFGAKCKKFCQLWTNAFEPSRQKWRCFWQILKLPVGKFSILKQRSNIRFFFLHNPHILVRDQFGFFGSFWSFFVSFWANFVHDGWMGLFFGGYSGQLGPFWGILVQHFRLKLHVCNFAWMLQLGRGLLFLWEWNWPPPCGSW